LKRIEKKLSSVQLLKQPNISLQHRRNDSTIFYSDNTVKLKLCS